MKIAVAGKGGVGKTTIAGSLARLYAAERYKVLAIDADPDANLASAIGITLEEEKAIIPLSKMKDLVRERTGAEPWSFGSYFKLNPKVDDIPDKFSFQKFGVRLLVMGSVEHGGAGCVCPESALLRALVRHLLLERDEVIIMDMEAGLEHLGRGTADSVDALLVVVEPSQKSIQTAKSIRKLSQEIGLKNQFLLVNKVRDEEEGENLKKDLKELSFLGLIHQSEKIRLADLKGKSPFDSDSKFVQEIKVIKDNLEKALRIKTKD